VPVRTYAAMHGMTLTIGDYASAKHEKRVKMKTIYELRVTHFANRLLMAFAPDWSEAPKDQIGNNLRIARHAFCQPVADGL